MTHVFSVSKKIIGRSASARGHSKEGIHFLKRPPLSLRIEQINDRHAAQVDRHEEEINPGTDVGDANGPYLCNDDGSNGTATGGQAQSAGAYSSGENLGKMSNRCFRGGTVVGFPYLGAVNPGGRAKSHTETERVDENENDTCGIGRSVDVVGVG